MALGISVGRVYSLALLAMLLTTEVTFGQGLKQNIRGKVMDADAKSPLIGASILVLNTDSVIGTTTDLDGSFKLEGLSVGRYDLKIAFMGYEDRYLQNLLLGAGKELVLNIDLQESFQSLNEVVIMAKHDKTRARNELGLVSARGFTVEETKRYAGSFQDPARMASAYAGVSSNPSGDNDIVIRGNSPKGLLWRIEGVEAPNPNHFASDGASGGPISILNSNMLDNSDFFTGAFPSEYGNAYSGVFDISLRKGNNEQREYAVQLSALGLDAAAEGPLGKDGQGSYLVNYRYSSLALLTAAGIKVAGDNVPEYQDAAFNISLPTNKLGSFALFGVGGLSSIEGEYGTDENPDQIVYKESYAADMGFLGFRHKLYFNNSSHLSTTLSWGGTSRDAEEFDLGGDDDFFKSGSIGNKESATRLNAVYSNKLNSRNAIKTGVVLSSLYYDLNSSFYSFSENRTKTALASSGQSASYQAFVNWKHRLTEKLTLNSGLHYMQFALNDNNSWEPRASLEYRLSPRHSLSAGFGVHSRLESLATYFAETTLSDGTTIRANQDLQLAKSNHYVLGYQLKLSENLNLKVEAYYQQLYDVPVVDSMHLPYSIQNFNSGYTTLPLTNQGKGYNYGIELSLERYFSEGYYFLLTSSLFESKYQALDGVTRNSRYNQGYVSNVLGGKEFKLGGNEKERVLTLSTKASFAGGLWYTPVDLQASIASGQTERDESRVQGVQSPSFHRIDLQIQLRTDKGKTTRTWMLDIQNVTNSLNPVFDYYNQYSQKIEFAKQLGLLPVISYKVEF